MCVAGRFYGVEIWMSKEPRYAPHVELGCVLGSLSALLPDGEFKMF